MPPKLRPFQSKLELDCYSAWAEGAVNIMPVAATGSGKTVLFSKLLYDEPGASIAIAHRQELISQIAIALARNGVRHRIVGANKANPLIRIITAIQVAELGYSFYDPTAKTGVGGVDTIVRMDHDPWFQQVRLMIQDEGHHVLRDNKWGRAAAMFPNSRGVFPTATPRRADGKGLGRHADGLTDAMVLAPTMREIINMGYLTDYRLFAPKSNLDLSNVHVTPSGELSPVEVKAAVEKSSIIGDSVTSYKQFAWGKRGVTFTVDIEEAIKTAAAYNAAGIPAEVISGKTPQGLRTAILNRFKAGEIWQLVNCDLFGEGFDLPAIEVVTMLRPSDSLCVYIQQFGRALRLLLTREMERVWDSLGDAGRIEAIRNSAKPYGIIIDHVNNWQRHGLPDKPRLWTLDRRDKRASKKEDAIPLKVCVQCLQPFERVYKRCPYCDHYLPPTARSGPDMVDGDLTEVDAAMLAALRGEISRIDGDFHAPQGLEVPAQMAARRRHMERQENQLSLRNAIAWWAGLEAARGHSESESYRRFYFNFGIDVANAQTLGSRESQELARNIHSELGKFGIDGTVNAEVYFSN